MKVLFVCLGNICRSPTAEAVFRELARREAPELGLEADSAGTADYHIGEPPDARSCAAALRRGFDLSAHRARQVTRADFARFDLVLAMDGANLADLVALAPEGARARLQRFLDVAPELSRPDVPDPYYGGPEAFERVLDLAELGAHRLIEQLRRSVAVEPA